MAKEFDKNRLKRLRVLDQLLCKEGDGYTIKELVEKVSIQLNESVDRYAISRDLKFLTENLGMSILYIPDKIIDVKNGQPRNVNRLKYENADDSLFNLTLNKEDIDILSMALQMLGLKGVLQMRTFNKLQLNTKVKNKIISYTANPQEKKIGNVFESLFRAIKNKEVIGFKLRDRLPPHKKISHIVRPWYLREYNRRWYMFGWDVKAQMLMHYALDRMEGSIKTIDKMEGKPATESIEKILDEVVGISIPESGALDIMFWVSDKSADFVSRKPIHHTQVEINFDDPILEMYGKLKSQGGKAFKIRCKINYELEREMISFGPELIVLSPTELQKKVTNKLKLMLDNYKQFTN
ncbi:MAG: WYL domain-containing protein [Muribaculaceae bacterium]|nr:WYL domain-containing protein [Muribaculaceae bacterium]